MSLVPTTPPWAPIPDHARRPMLSARKFDSGPGTAPVLARPDPLVSGMIVVEDEHGVQSLVTEAAFRARYRFHDAFGTRSAFATIVAETPNLVVFLDHHPIQGERPWPHVLITVAPKAPHLDGWMEAAGDTALLRELQVAREFVAQWFQSFGAVPLFLGNDSPAGGWVRNPKQKVQHVHMHAVALADDRHAHPGEEGIAAFRSSTLPALCSSVSWFTDPTFQGKVEALASDRAYSYAQAGIGQPIFLMAPIGAAMSELNRVLGAALNLPVAPDPAQAGTLNLHRRGPAREANRGNATTAFGRAIAGGRDVAAALADPSGPAADRFLERRFGQTL